MSLEASPLILRFQPRVTVDEIIARRAPERSAKTVARAARRAAQAKEAADGDGEAEENDLELAMMEELGAELSEGDDEDDEEDDESDEEGSDGPVSEPEDVVVDDDEDWLKLGQESDEEGEGEAKAEAVESVPEKEENSGASLHETCCSPSRFH